MTPVYGVSLLFVSLLAVARELLVAFARNHRGVVRYAQFHAGMKPRGYLQSQTNNFSFRL